MSGYQVSSTDGALRLGESDTVRSILQRIEIILSTGRGSVPNYREFGVDMELLDLPIPAAEQRIRIDRREAIERWEPRAKVVDITFSRDEAQLGKLIPIVEVEIVEP